MVADRVSLTYGHVAAIAAAATVGCWVASFFHVHETTIRGLIPAFVVAVGGSAFVGYIEPEPPLSGILLVPVAPLALWTCTWGRLGRLRGVTAGVVQTAVVLVPVVISLLWVLMGEGTGGVEEY